MTKNFPSFRRNYFLTSVEGSFFMGGIAFLSMEAVMPAMVKELGGPNWAIAIAPVLMIIGFGWPQVISALWVERMLAMKPFIVRLGFIQRLPYLATAVLLLLWGADYPNLAVASVIIAPLLTASVGGIIGAAYFELVTRMIPVNRVASMWAIRNSLFAIFGIAAGIIIKWILDIYPGVVGYGILHFMAFGMLVVSFVILIYLKEDNLPETKPTDPISFRIGFEAFINQWRTNPSLGMFVITRILYLFIFVAVPFLSIRAIEITGSASSLLGMLVVPQMVGSISGNFMMGYLGDRGGVRLPMLLGRYISIAAIVGALFSQAPWHFMVVFFLLGMGIGTGHIGDITLIIDFAPPKRRKFFYGVMGLLVLPGPLIAVVISTVLRDLDDGFYLACCISIIAILLSLIYLKRLKDPRTEPVQAFPMDPQSAQTGNQLP